MSLILRKLKLSQIYLLELVDYKTDFFIKTTIQSEYFLSRLKFIIWFYRRNVAMGCHKILKYFALSVVSII